MIGKRLPWVDGTLARVPGRMLALSAGDAITRTKFGAAFTVLPGGRNIRHSGIGESSTVSGSLRNLTSLRSSDADRVSGVLRLQIQERCPIPFAAARCSTRVRDAVFRELSFE